MRQLVTVFLLVGSSVLLVGCTNTAHRPHRGTAHNHDHAADCGHLAIRHAGHVDYLHDGHLHHVHGDHVDEHVIPVSTTNPDGCTTQLNDHQHGPECGHPKVPHGDHHDYLVDGRLHHAHDGHCDDHGMVEVVK